ncbi:MAG: tripartite tricarboxylate transporter substrate binding protein [Xanthobacteraceae bacterium]|nr:tripartite tricarboxylate transporter substrate binding protein [Xanthobacteraceae bacterium]
MKCPVRLLPLVAIASALGCLSVSAQDVYPSKPVKIVIPFAPGGAADTFGRLIGNKLNGVWSQPVIVENKTGAGGQVATQNVVNAPADGYTLLIVTVGHAVNPWLYPNLPYDTEKDLKPVAMLAQAPSVLAINPAVPAKSVAELIALAKAKPNALNYGSAGNASTSHIAGAMLASLGGVQMTHVPYRGSAPAMTDLIGGQIQFIIDPIVSSAQHVKAGKLRALAISTASRSPLAPELPPIGDMLQGYDFSSWFMLLAPAKTPDAIVQKIHDDVERALASSDVKERYTAMGAETGKGTSAEVARFLSSEIKRYARVVKEAGMKAE